MESHSENEMILSDAASEARDALFNNDLSDIEARIRARETLQRALERAAGKHPDDKQADFSVGDVVVSVTTRDKVRVTDVSDCGKWFSGTRFGNAVSGDLPANFHYHWKAWRASEFEKEFA